MDANYLTTSLFVGNLRNKHVSLSIVEAEYIAVVACTNALLKSFQFVRSIEELADIFIKDLPEPNFMHTLRCLGMMDSASFPSLGYVFFIVHLQRFTMHKAFETVANQ